MSDRTTRRREQRNSTDGERRRQPSARATWSLCLLGALSLAFASVVLAPGTALAGPKAARRAAKAFNSGTRLFQQRKYVGAIAAFERAYELRPHFMVLCSVARCYENLNRMVSAARYYRRCLDGGAAVSKMASRIKASLKSVEQQITVLTVNSAGEGGAVHVDGRASGRAPGKIKLNPGTHVVEVRRAGTRPARITVQTLGGEQRSVTLTPIPLLRPKAIIADQRPRAEPTPLAARERGLSQVWFWTAVGATLAIAAAATTFGVLTLSAKSDFEATPTQDSLDGFKSKRLITNVLIGAAAAAGAGATTLFFFTDFNGGGQRDRRAHGALGVGIGVAGLF